MKPMSTFKNEICLRVSHGTYLGDIFQTIRIQFCTHVKLNFTMQLITLNLQSMSESILI